MQSLQNKRILVGVTGGIAAYKAPDVVRRLRDLGAEVKVIMTRGACEFITPLTLQAVSGNRVHTELLDAEAEAAMGHIELARWGDAIVVAPATADALARFAVGRADDLLATVLCASDAPVLLAPAMNQAMWRDQANQTNLQRLAERGYRTVGPGEGAQACGDTGAGRMSEAAEIAQAVADCFASGILDGRHVVITAGPSLEALDPVRYLSNYSSGKMGFALATAAIEAGAKVTLIAGPVHLPADARAQRVDVVSAQDMLEAVMGVIDGADIFVGAAAVADFRPVTSESQKIKKTAAVQTLTLELEKTPDIIAAVSSLISPPVVVGFAAETHDLLEHANAKMQRKNLQMIVANDVSRDDIGFSSDSNEVIVLTRSEQVEMPKMSKDQLARELIKLIAQQV